MNFIFVLLGTIAVVFAIIKPLKSHAPLFYVFAIALNALYIAAVYSSLPSGIWQALFLLMQKCTLSLAIFVVVMFIGVLSKDSKIGMMLRPVRAELSIMGCILACGHMAVYLAAFVPRVFGGYIDTNFAVFFATAMVLLVLLLMLGITSFGAVKRRMNTATWKRIQKWAYVFFGLIYVHLVSILLPSALASGITAKVSIVVYTVLFGLYTILRIRRAMIDSKSLALQNESHV